MELHQVSGGKPTTAAAACPPGNHQGREAGGAKGRVSAIFTASAKSRASRKRMLANDPQSSGGPMQRCSSPSFRGSSFRPSLFCRRAHASTSSARRVWSVSESGVGPGRNRKTNCCMGKLPFSAGVGTEGVWPRNPAPPRASAATARTERPARPIPVNKAPRLRESFIMSLPDRPGRRGDLSRVHSWVLPMPRRPPGSASARHPPASKFRVASDKEVR